MTTESLSLYLQKIRICCEDFSVYMEIKKVEDLRLDRYNLWINNWIKWRKEIEFNFMNFSRFGKECQLIFIERAGSILAGLVVCLQSFITDNINLTVKTVVSYTDYDSRKNKICLALKAIKMVGEYFKICKNADFEVVGLDDYFDRFEYILFVVRKLKVIFMAIENK